ncbi:hypothetical protein HY605_04685 [Candidatus Peregrinibacteria bacterium]|nr:hypothetical protein [Candidatus Peregrinibacteria bacterium]
MEKGLKIMLVVLAIFGLATFAVAQQTQWENELTGTEVADPVDGDDATAEAATVSQSATGIAVDADGIVYVCGTADDADGTVVWIASFNGSSGATIDVAAEDDLGASAGDDDRANDIAVDSARNLVHVVGATIDVTGDVNDSDAFLWTVDTDAGELAGVEDFATVFDVADGIDDDDAAADSGDDGNGEEAFGVAVDESNGNIYIVGGVDVADDLDGIIWDGATDWFACAFTYDGTDHDIAVQAVLVDTTADDWVAYDCAFSGGFLYVCGASDVAGNLRGFVAKRTGGALADAGSVIYNDPDDAADNEDEYFSGIAVYGSAVYVCGSRTADDATAGDDDLTDNGLVCKYPTDLSTLTWDTEIDDTDIGETDGDIFIHLEGIACDGDAIYVTGHGGPDTAGADGLEVEEEVLDAQETGDEDDSGAGAGEADDGETEGDDADVSVVVVAKLNSSSGALIWDNTYNDADGFSQSGWAVAIAPALQVAYIAGQVTGTGDTDRDGYVLSVSRGGSAGAGGAGAAGAGGGGGGGCGTIGLDALALIGIAYLVNRKARKS